MSEVQEIDAWCVKQLERLRGPMESYLLKGGNLNNPEYRQQLGQHTAFMRMRSYLHGSVRAHLQATQAE